MLKERFDLTGKVALVTGGSKGLGKEMARIFVEAGAKVIISSRSEKELAAAAQEIAGSNAGKIVYEVSDLSVRKEVDRLVPAALAHFGRIDILVNNAGSNCPQPIDEIKDEDWDRIMELNLTNIMRLTRALVPGMKERRWGRIIHISSVLGLGGKEGRGIYSSSKAGILGLTYSTALDLGPFNITVNSIAPGPFLTDLPKSLLNEEQQQGFSDRTAMGRWGDPKEIAGPALLLASDAGSYITGTCITVDGGVMAKVL
ncbi:MAG: 3-oxoacyl-ACP reductase FabG [Verrucomicrobia bacterium]|jgi:NAD(P)-dependent dehydrogenase (short-subunit alcohol dehydrogenase family)|nr:3-oxoacyl-ACP reductase FabG [Verrucomicrobiota bacterium]